MHVDDGDDDSNTSKRSEQAVNVSKRSAKTEDERTRLKEGSENKAKAICIPGSEPWRELTIMPATIKMGLPADLFGSAPCETSSLLRRSFMSFEIFRGGGMSSGLISGAGFSSTLFVTSDGGRISASLAAAAEGGRGTVGQIQRRNIENKKDEWDDAVIL